MAAITKANSPGKVTAVYSARGGEGVSSIASQLALSLAKRKPTAIVDLVVENEMVSRFLRFNPSLNADDISPGEVHRGSSILSKISHPKHQNLCLFRYVKPTFDRTNLSKLLASARDCFGYVVLDLPHSTLLPVVPTALEIADSILVIVQYHWHSTEKVAAFFKSEIGVRCEREHKVSVVLNKVSWLPQDIVEECRGNLGRKVAFEIPLDSGMLDRPYSLDGPSFRAAVKKLTSTMQR